MTIWTDDKFGQPRYVLLARSIRITDFSQPIESSGMKATALAGKEGTRKSHKFCFGLCVLANRDQSPGRVSERATDSTVR